MNRSITGAMLGLILFLAAYCLCFWYGVMPKFYPGLGEVHINPPPGNPIAVKFVGSAAVGMAAWFLGFLVGRKLPERAGVFLHILVWMTLLAACIYLVGRETMEYILPG